jgi:hypothetical protein
MLIFFKSQVSRMRRRVELRLRHRNGFLLCYLAYVPEPKISESERVHVDRHIHWRISFITLCSNRRFQSQL